MKKLLIVAALLATAAMPDACVRRQDGDARAPIATENVHDDAADARLHGHDEGPYEDDAAGDAENGHARRADDAQDADVRARTGRRGAPLRLHDVIWHRPV